MKNVRDIINQINSDPSYVRNKDRAKFISLLPINFRKMISFVYIEPKNSNLMIVLKHPLGLQELKRDSNIKIIKDVLKIFLKFKPYSEFSAVKEIKFFVSRRYLMSQNTNKILKRRIRPKQPEISSGKFKNNIKDEKIHAIFEEIRGLILANRRD